MKEVFTVPSFELDDSTAEILRQLHDASLEFQTPLGTNCSHWSIKAADKQIACSCNGDDLKPLLGLLQKVAQAVATQEVDVNQAHSRNLSCETGTPTPADITTQPLTYTPPVYKTSQRTQILPAALAVLEKVGFTLADAVAVIEDPLDVIPTYQWGSIYRGQHFEVVYSNQDEVIFSILAPSERSGDFGVPRLAGQKSDVRLPLPDSPEAMVKLLKDRGFVLEHGGKHWKISYPPVAGVFASMPYTPSDYRWAKNLMTELRAKFGIDLRR